MHLCVDIDDDTKFHSLAIEELCVEQLQRGLDIPGAADGIDGACKLGQYAVTGRADKPAVMFFDQSVYGLAEVVRPRQGTLLVRAH